MAEALTPQSALHPPQTSVHDRLLALETKQLAYRSLSHRLLQLPHKLRRRALVPVGPRLYLPGELVRTNEILVLLGSAGEATYFAERSAWQAHEIVRRRLGRVERGLRELLDDVDSEFNVDESLGHSNDVGRSKAPVKSADNSPERVLVHSANNVAHSQVVHSCAQSAPSAHIDESQAVETGTTNQVVLSREVQPVSVLKTKTPQPSPAKQKRRVRFSDPLIHPCLHSTPQPCFLSPPKLNTKAKKKNMASSSSKKEELSSEQNEEHETLVSASGHVKKAESDANAEELTKAKVMEQFRLAVENAQRQVLDDGIVNITEVYEKDEETPSRVVLPPGFEPDKNVSFADGSDEFLDMSGTTEEVAEGEVSRQDYFDALTEVEKESKAEEERQETEKRRNDLEREKREFGRGFSKGFFGAAPKKRTQIEKESMSKCERTPSEIPSTQVVNSSSTSVMAGVVERKPSRKSKRRNRRPRSGTVMFPPSVPTALLRADAVGNMEIEGLGQGEEEGEGESEGSMFRRLRDLQQRQGTV
ncbi:unnamed protein product [Agarophyton chilense]|eukprot:gb/GEZJ01000174.1/.p1 GENE.gb/GEZJ01000174.1/~~gb/GEZJ01000174.1/.p1  ORF type:complete len:531 (-),score=92.24 gb/GEZJ01000174.1/:502-2094(-)